MEAQLNKRERKAQQLLAHYAKCEALAQYCGMPKADGKKISVALVKLERIGADAALSRCNDSSFTQEQWEAAKEQVKAGLISTLGKVPPGFFLNGDPRGYALKIDNETHEGKALIEAVKLHTDWGGYGILSPEIDGN